MHILEIPSFFTPYGGEFCLDQASALARLEHEVRILSNVQLSLTISPKGYLSFPFRRYLHEMNGITIYQSFQRGIPKQVKWNVERWVAIVCDMFDDYVARYGKPDILHAHCAKWAGYAAMKIAQQHHIPYVITEHLSFMSLKEEFGQDADGAWQVALLRQAYENANMVVPVSAELVKDTSCYYGENYKWQSISNTIDTDFFCYKPRRPREGRPFRFCCVADNTYRKGYDVLIPAFRMLKEKCNEVELKVAGRDTDRKEFLAQLGEGIVSCGRIGKSEVHDLLYQSDALVLASRSEVQPLVLLEAMATGIPVIATECTPQNLRIAEGCTIVPTDNASALADAMKQVMEQRVDGNQLSESVRQLASPEVVGKRLSDLFVELLVASRHA